MEGTTETSPSRLKHAKNLLLVKNDRGDDREAKEDDATSLLDSKKTYVYCSRKKKNNRKERSFENCHKSSMLSIVTSLNDNCCLCCGAFLRYLRAVFSCVSCFVMCRIPEMEFERLFCDLLEACGGACFDLMCFIRKFLHVCIGTDK